MYQNFSFKNYLTEVRHMKNEDIFLDTLFKKSSCNYEVIPKLNSVEEVRLQESISGNLNWYNIPAEVFDKFLLEHFEYDIEGFRKLYIKRHLAAFGCTEDEVSAFARCVNPIPDNIQTYFGKVNSLSELTFKYKRYQEIIKTHTCSESLSLHDDTISNFTLIRACFSQLIAKPETLEQMENDLSFGYYVPTEKYRFLISSSIQLDLTVVYEEI